MKRRAFPRLLLLVLPAALAATACGGQSSSARDESAAHAVESDRGGPKTFTSTRYGYSVDVPSDWLTPDQFAEETKGMWSGVLDPLAPGVDTFTDSEVRTYLFAAARPVERRVTLKGWVAALDEGVPFVCAEPETREDRQVGGAQAVVLSYHCSDGYFVLMAAALERGRGFAIGWASPEGSERKDRARFDRILDSLAFHTK